MLIALFMLELGKRFAFVGKQYSVEVGGDDFYSDLLFYTTSSYTVMPPLS
jgi:predicted nuclease of restriction endonuclease-like (RecB) superfamily